MRLHRTRRLRSLLATTAALLVVAVGATACGDDGDGGSRDDSTNGSSDPTESADTEGSEGSEEPVTSGPLSAEQALEAVLTVENLGEGWAEEDVDDDEDDEEEDAPGCLSEIDDLTDDDARVEKAEKQFGYGDQGVPQVNSTVSTYEDADDLGVVFDQVEKAIEQCSSINYEDDGYTYDLSMRALTDLALDVDVDDQFSFVSSGTFSKDGESHELYLYGTFIRVGATVGTVGTTSLEDVGSQQQAYATIGAARLAAVAAGETPAQTVALAP